MDLNLELRNEMQRGYLALDGRNICISGGFGNGKSYVGCLKLAIMLMLFPKYRVAIGRQFYKDLRNTTMETMMKIIPQEFIKTHDFQNGLTTLVNGSTILWMHLDHFDEQSLRGLEINSALLDQAEEIDEAIFLILDARIGRWDQAEVPEDLKAGWPVNQWGKPVVKNFFDILCNPDSLQHWIYRKFHPDSVEKDSSYQYIEAATDINLNDPVTIKQVLGRDPEWVAKYFKGEWGASDAQIHFISKASKIFIDDVLLERIKSRAAISLVLDHGDSSPTAAILAAAIDGVYVVFSEYYVPGRVISYHRRELAKLCESYHIVTRYADPQIFKKTAQKDGGFWSVAEEYLDKNLDAPPIYFAPADNNEFATRNRINELLQSSLRFKHPITGETPAPGLYFALPNSGNGTGVTHVISETEMQKKELLTSDNGKAIYSDERDDSVVDHAYDTLRYYCAMHGTQKSTPVRRPPKNSFAHYNAILADRKNRAPVSAWGSE